MTRGNNKFIADEDIVDVKDWSFAAVDQASIRFAAKVKAQAELENKAKEDLERARLDAIRQAGHAKGYEEGFAQGHAQATLEGQRQIAQYIRAEGAQAAQNFARLFAAAEQQIADAEQSIAQGVLELACEVARQVVRRELSTNPNAVLPVIRQSLSLLLSDGKTAVIRLNPQDLELLRDVLRQEFSSMDLTLLPDASLSHGSCLAEAASTVVDGTVQNRWHVAVASLGLDSAWEVEDDPR